MKGLDETDVLKGNGTDPLYNMIRNSFEMLSSERFCVSSVPAEAVAVAAAAAFSTSSQRS